MCVMSKFNDKRVLITGGASGIGRLMGAMALEKGASTLVIWDINQQSIDDTIAELTAKGKVVGYRVDISDEQLVIEAAKAVKQQVGQIDILINCAGIITSNKTFDNGGDSSHDEYQHSGANGCRAAVSARYDCSQ